MSDATAVCREVYTETRRRYAEVEAQLGPSAIGFRVLYGPPTMGAPYLFLGYQPGGRGIEDAQHHETWPARSDYATKNWPLAKQVRAVWGEEVAASCTGLNAIFFRAPSVAAWQRIAKPLRGDLERFSLRHAERIVAALRPQSLIVIGLRTYDWLLIGEPCLRGERGRVLAKEGSLWGCPAIGTVHLSGSRISSADRERLRSHFAPQSSHAKPARRP